MKNEQLTLDLELIAVTINYYLPIGRWKKSIGMTDDRVFEKYSPTTVRSMVYALDELGILEKHPASDKKSAIYRLQSKNLEQWQKILGTLLGGGIVLPPLSLRDLTMLYVAGTFQLKQGRPPKTSELFFKDSKNSNAGLLNNFMVGSGIIDEVIFEVTSTIYIHRSATILAHYGLMIERGSRARAARKPFEVTAKGLTLVAEMKKCNWNDWLSMAKNI